jgi:hypothetical protein
VQKVNGITPEKLLLFSLTDEIFKSFNPRHEGIEPVKKLLSSQKLDTLARLHSCRGIDPENMLCDNPNLAFIYKSNRNIEIKH